MYFFFACLFACLLVFRAGHGTIFETGEPPQLEHTKQPYFFLLPRMLESIQMDHEGAADRSIMIKSAKLYIHACSCV